MGRAVVRADHRNGAVVLLMWAGILAYLDRCGYDYVTGCVSVPTHGELPPGSQIRGVRDFVLRRHAAAPVYTVRPYRRWSSTAAASTRSSPGPARPATADARLSAPRRTGVRRTGARPGVRRRRLPGPAGQAGRRRPLPQAVAVGVGAVDMAGGMPS